MKKKKVKTKKVLGKKGLNKKFIIGAIIIIIMSVLCCYIAYTYEINRVSIKEDIVLESGSNVPRLSDFVDKFGRLDKNSKITYENTDKKQKSKSLRTTTIYLDKKNKEVTKEKAYNQEIKSLKKGYIEKNVVISTGTYKIIITDKRTKRKYESKLVVKDTTKPKLKLKNVEISVDDEIKVDNFIEEKSDNSHEELDIYFVKEITDKKKKEYEKIEKIDTSNPQELEIIIIAKDKSNNETIEKAKLKIKEKSVEENEEVVVDSSTGQVIRKGTTNSTNGNYSSGVTQSGVCADYYGLNGAGGFFYDAGPNGMDLSEYISVSDRLSKGNDMACDRSTLGCQSLWRAVYDAENGLGNGCGYSSVGYEEAVMCKGSGVMYRGITYSFEAKNCNGQIVSKGWIDTGGGLHYTYKTW